MPGVPEIISRRKPLAPYLLTPAGAGGAGTDTSLDDLAGLLPDDELMAAQAAAALQRLLMLPQLSCVVAHGCSDGTPPAQMYT